MIVFHISFQGLDAINEPRYQPFRLIRFCFSKSMVCCKHYCLDCLNAYFLERFFERLKDLVVTQAISCIILLQYYKYHSVRLSFTHQLQKVHLRQLNINQFYHCVNQLSLTILFRFQPIQVKYILYFQSSYHT